MEGLQTDSRSQPGAPRGTALHHPTPPQRGQAPAVKQWSQSIPFSRGPLLSLSAHHSPTSLSLPLPQTAPKADSEFSDSLPGAGRPGSVRVPHEPLQSPSPASARSQPAPQDVPSVRKHPVWAEVGNVTCVRTWPQFKFSPNTLKV